MARMNINMIQNWWGLNHVKWLHRYDPKRGESPFFSYWAHSNTLYFILNSLFYVAARVMWFLSSSLVNLVSGGPKAPASKTTQPSTNGKSKKKKEA